MIIIFTTFIILSFIVFSWDYQIKAKWRDSNFKKQLKSQSRSRDLERERAHIFLEITYGAEFLKSISEEQYLNLIDQTVILDNGTKQEKRELEGNLTNEIILPFDLVDGKRIPSPRISNSRLGQDKFKRVLLKAYDFKCCISGNENTELLEAAHIQEYKGIMSNHIQNGLLLRVDIHRLFDSKLIAIDGDYKIIVSDLAPDYKYFNGKEISLPINPDFYPSKLALRQHQIKLLTNSLMDTGNTN